MKEKQHHNQEQDKTEEATMPRNEAQRLDQTEQKKLDFESRKQEIKLRKYEIEMQQQEQELHAAVQDSEFQLKKRDKQLANMETVARQIQDRHELHMMQQKDLAEACREVNKYWSVDQWWWNKIEDINDMSQETKQKTVCDRPSGNSRLYI